MISGVRMQNRTIHTADNLDIMREIASNTFDLIYLDPPFNSGKVYSASEGSQSEGAEFKDVWYPENDDKHWHLDIQNQDPMLYKILLLSAYACGPNMRSYLIMLSVRLLEMVRIMKPSGSIYLHCDSTSSHYLKVIMDKIFGVSNFQREIIWRPQRASGGKTKANNWIRNHDVILYYASEDRTFNKQHYPYDEVYTGHRRASGPGLPYESVIQINGMQTQSVSEQEGTGYPTQKPLGLLKLIIKASSNPGDMVLDPFSGSGTALIAAENLDRQWVGIDVSKKAIEIAKTRLRDKIIFGLG